MEQRLLVTKTWKKKTLWHNESGESKWDCKGPRGFRRCLSKKRGHPQKGPNQENQSKGIKGPVGGKANRPTNR